MTRIFGQSVFLPFVVLCATFWSSVSIAEEWNGETAGEGRSLTIDGVETVFRFCPSGTFEQGRSNEKEGRWTWETRHKTSFAKGFWIAETETTQRLWTAIMGTNPSCFKGEERPVDRVSWNDCQEFIAKLNEMGAAPEGFRFALPTEAQWEYACRAGTSTPFAFGNSLAGLANFGRWNVGDTKNVKSFKPNAWNLYDMHGNICEWCFDSYESYPSSSQIDPCVDGSESRVIRGGSWFQGPWFCQSTYRESREASIRVDYLGFRLALVPTSN